MICVHKIIFIHRCENSDQKLIQNNVHLLIANAMYVIYI